MARVAGSGTANGENPEVNWVIRLPLVPIADQLRPAYLVPE
jgi:hypothetical protein